MRIHYMLILMLLCHSINAQEAFQEGYGYERMWPAPKQPWYFDQPRSIAIDSQGFVYISSETSNQVRRFTEHGEFVRQWRFSDAVPKHIAVDPADNLYVLYSKTKGRFHRQKFIRVFDDKGQLQHVWGEGVTTQGDYSISSRTLAVDHNSHVYLVNDGYSVLNQFTIEGEHLNAWHLEPYAQTSKDMRIVVDKANHVYVLYPNVDAPEQVPNPDKYAIVKYDADGNKINEWGQYGDGAGEFIQPISIALDKYEYLYVSDKHKLTIQKFSKQGVFIEEIDGLSEADSEPLQPIIENSAFNLFFGASPELVEMMILELGMLGRLFTESLEQNTLWIIENNDRTNLFQSVLDWMTNGHNHFQPHSIALHPRNNDMYVTHAANLISSVRSYSPEGAMSEWSSSNGMYYHEGRRLSFRPSAIAQYTTPEGQVYLFVADMMHNRILKFKENGAYVDSFGQTGTRLGQLITPLDIAIDSQGMLYVAELGNLRIQKFDISAGQFEFIHEVGNATYNAAIDPKNGLEAFYAMEEKYVAIPMFLAIDRQDNLYVVDISRNRIQKFSADGEALLRFGGTGSEEHELMRVSGMAIDKHNHVYILDNGDRLIQKYDERGEYVRSYSSPLMDSPASIAIDTNNNLYLYDYVTAFSKHVIGTERLSLVTRWGERGTYPNQVSHTTRLTVRPDGQKVYAAEMENNRIQVFEKDFFTAGKAIVIAGSKKLNVTDDPLWDDTQLNANQAYRTLRYRGFTKEQIRYITAETKNINKDELDKEHMLPATPEQVEEAITQWALEGWPSRIKNLTIYIVDHGEDGQFILLEDATVSAEQLNEWVTAWQNKTQGIVTIIYDACYAGSIVETLQYQDKEKEIEYPNRIIMTSSGPTEVVNSLPFSKIFWTHIFNGLSLQDAYEQAAQDVRKLGNEPRLVDTSNQIEGLYIGDVNVRIEDKPSEISYDIITQQETVMLGANVQDQDGVFKVWANISLPYKNPEDSDENIIKCELKPIQWPSKQYNYMAECPGFTELGTYQVALNVKDKNNNPSSVVVKQYEYTRGLRRKAMIIAAGAGEQIQYANIAPRTRLVYEALINQGYEPNDIRYLINVSENIAQRTFPADLETIDRILSGQDGWLGENLRDFVIYIFGYGDDMGITLDSDGNQLSFAQLQTYLHTIQEQYVNDEQLVVFYEGYNSGHLLRSLAAIPEREAIRRIVVTSHNQAGYHPTLGSHLTDFEFSEFFWQQIAQGKNISRAFKDYKQDNFSGMIDDNHDGIYSKEQDGKSAEGHWVGLGVTPANATADPESAKLQLFLPETQADEQVYLVISPMPIGEGQTWYIITDTNQLVPYQGLEHLSAWQGTSHVALDLDLSQNTTELPIAGQYWVYFLAVSSGQTVYEALQNNALQELMIQPQLN